MFLEIIFPLAIHGCATLPVDLRYAIDQLSLFLNYFLLLMILYFFWFLASFNTFLHLMILIIIFL